ncbi:MAG: hypothetical protein KBC64_01585 [Simkaniaceae bacterium]|nr:hypothetical protein [Simkaniaceae bacterium]
MSIVLDRTMNNIENTLTDAASYPVLGIIPGALQGGIGVVQATAALAFGILTLPALCIGKTAPTRHAWAHFKHGLANTVVGPLQAIPGIGCISTTLRTCKTSVGGSDWIGRVEVKTGTPAQKKCMTYPSLEEESWCFYGNYKAEAYQQFKEGKGNLLSPRAQVVFARLIADAINGPSS